MPKCCQAKDCNYPVFSHGFCRLHQRFNPKFKFPEFKKSPIKKTFNKISPVSDKRLEEMKEYRIVRDAFMITHPICQAKVEGCTYYSCDNHHRKGKEGKLLCDVKWFMAVCRHCHNWIDANPNKAREKGFIVNRSVTETG